MALQLSTKPYLIAYRSLSGIAVLCRLMAQEGLAAEKLLAGSGIRIQDLNDPDIMVSPEQELAVVRRTIALSSIPELGIVSGFQGHVGVNGTLGMAWMCCDTLLDVFQMAFQYIDLTLTFFQHSLAVLNDRVRHRLKETIMLDGLQYFVGEREIASIVRMLSDVLNKSFKPAEIRFAFPRPDYAAVYQRFFDCDVYFDAGHHEIVFEKKWLEYSLPKSDPLMKKKYETECRQLSRRYEECKTTADAVYQVILSFGEVYPKIGEVASRVSMSPRNLRRKLTAEGTSYQKILNNVRRVHACRLLKNTNDSIENIAAKIGYSNTANFYHAFNRWVGQTPGEYRASSHLPKPDTA